MSSLTAIPLLLKITPPSDLPYPTLASFLKKKVLLKIPVQFDDCPPQKSSKSKLVLPTCGFAEGYPGKDDQTAIENSPSTVFSGKLGHVTESITAENSRRSKRETKG